MCQVTFDLNSVTLDMFFDFSPEFEDRFHNHGCINWNLYLEWIEENTEDILADFNKSGYENIDDFCLDDWRM